MQPSFPSRSRKIFIVALVIGGHGGNVCTCRELTETSGPEVETPEAVAKTHGWPFLDVSTTTCSQEANNDSETSGINGNEIANPVIRGMVSKRKQRFNFILYLVKNCRKRNKAKE